MELAQKIREGIIQDLKNEGHKRPTRQQMELRLREILNQLVDEGKIVKHADGTYHPPRT
jgi:hypothetical protein